MLNAIKNTAIYFLLVAVLMFGLPKALTELLDTPYPMAAVTSGSMWPALKEGDLVFIEGVEQDELEIGDVVVFRGEYGLTIHRIVELNNDTLVTKGDANFREDTPVVYEKVVGRQLTLWGQPVRMPYFGAISVLANNLKE